MAESNIEQKVIFTGDASQLTTTFEQLMAEIQKTREELQQLKGDKEKTAEATQKLNDQEMRLVELINSQNGVIDSSKVSYKQLNDVLKDLNKSYKNVGDVASRTNMAPALKSINSELKTMDANVGNYQRNVGNYQQSVEQAMNSVRVNGMQVLRELPSLSFGIEQFFIAISNNLPMLVESLERLSAARAAEKAAATEQVAANATELASKKGLTVQESILSVSKEASAKATLEEKQKTLELIQAEIAENEATMASYELDKTHTEGIYEQIEAADALIAAINSLKVTQENRHLKMQQSNKDDVLTARKLLETYGKEGESFDDMEKRAKKTARQIRILTDEENNYLELAKKNKELKEKYNKLLLEGAEAANKNTEAVKKGVGIFKSFSSWIVILLTLITVFSKSIRKALKELAVLGKTNERYNAVLSESSEYMGEFSGRVEKSATGMIKLNNSMVNGSSSAKLFHKEQKELNAAMMEGAKSSAKEYVELRLLSSIINDASKSTEDHSKAASKLLEILGETATATAIAAVQTGTYDAKIQSLIETLYKQAQAQGAIQLLEKKYSETVLDAQGKYIDAEMNKQENKIRGFWSALEYLSLNAGNYLSKEDYLDIKVKKWGKKLDVAKIQFETFLAEVTKIFNFDEMFPEGNDNKTDDWFSKWEMYIKKVETLKGQLIGENNTINLAESWKYSADGLDAYMKKFAELSEHYKDDAKQFQEIQIQKQQYLNEYANYHLKLQLQWESTNKTSRQKDLDNLEEWYRQQLIIYNNAGEKTENLTNEYNNRKEAIERKYVDKYVNIAKEGLDRELADLKTTFDNELYEYEQKGIATVNLTLKYEKEKAKIISQYAAENTRNTLMNLRREEEFLQGQNNVKAGWNEIGGANMNVEMSYGKLGGTSITDHYKRQNEISATYNEYSIWSDSTNAQIDAMKKVLDSGKLVGEEKLAMEMELADAEKGLALGTAEYQMRLNQMKVDDARATTDEILSYTQQGFQGMGDIFDNVYTAIERNLDAQVASGEKSEEAAAKELDKYRGIKAAGAAMDAFGAAVSAYSSLAPIPVVGPALGAAAAAAALAAGMANVKLIMNTTSDNAGTQSTNSFVNATPSLSNYTPQYTQNITSKSDTDYLTNALSEKPIKTYVVESEVTAKQEIANKRNQETTW